MSHDFDMRRDFIMRLLLLLHWTLMGAALAAPLFWPVNTIAGLLVTEWNLRTSVFDSPAVVQDVDGTNTVQNPLQDQFNASIPPSMVSATYQISWDINSLFFALDTTLHAESLNGNVNSFGFMRVTPEVDSVLIFDGSYFYNMPTQPARASMSFTVSRTNPTQTIFSSSQVRTNFIGPPSGTLLLNDSVFLSAGETWRIGWSFGLIHFDPPIPGAASNGTGHLAFQIHPVPDPSALAPLAFAALLLRRRGHREQP